MHTEEELKKEELTVWIEEDRHICYIESATAPALKTKSAESKKMKNIQNPASII